MSSGHGFFAAFNRTVNPPVKLLLRSPAHGVVSRRLALITVTGRRSGRRFTIPVGYRETDEGIEISVGWPERKRWWRNLRGGGPVRVRVKGAEHTGWAEARGDEQTGVTVDVKLRD
jgi:hypothetical protein